MTSNPLWPKTWSTKKRPSKKLVNKSVKNKTNWLNKKKKKGDSNKYKKYKKWRDLYYLGKERSFEHLFKVSIVNELSLKRALQFLELP